MTSSIRMDFVFALCLVAFLAVRFVLQKQRLKKAERWPETEGTIQTVNREVFKQTHGNVIELPVCAFTYKLEGEYYSGRFSLHSTNSPTACILGDLVGQKIPVRYDPRRPGDWYVPLETLGERVIEQKLRSSLINLSPKD